MACEVCRHCIQNVNPYEEENLFGHSYYTRCRKCYVCSETDLHDAEVFKGVIFCHSCSQRIFQGCSTAKKTKDSPSRRRRNKSSKRRRHGRLSESAGDRDGILELTTLAARSSTSWREEDRNGSKSSPDHDTPLQGEKQMLYNNKIAYNLQKSSIDIGITTDVTQQLLMQMTNDCPTYEYRITEPMKTKPVKKKKSQKISSETESDDMRVAELGVSTEIASMALRNKSEMPVILNPALHKYHSVHEIHRDHQSRDQRDSFDRDQSWIDSPYSSEQSTTSDLFTISPLSWLLLPYKLFRRAIVRRSSIISSILSSKSEDPGFMNKLRDAFYAEINDHHKSGLKKLYSTINRKKIRNKMGWLHLENTKLSDNGCKHYQRSHSYRCMRNQVMKLAGPTRSELQVLRKKIAGYIAPDFMKRAVTYNTRFIEVVSRGNSIQSSPHKK